MQTFDLAARFNTAHFLHTHIHQDYLGVQYSHFCQGLRPIAGFSHHYEVCLRLNDGTHAHAYYLVIIDNHDANFCHVCAPTPCTPLDAKRSRDLAALAAWLGALHREACPHAGAAAWILRYLETAAEFFRSFPHSSHAMTTVDTLALSIRVKIITVRYNDRASAIITDLDLYDMGRIAQIHRDLCCIGVFIGIGKRLLSDTKDGGSYLGNLACTSLVSIRCLFSTLDL